jgi:hypothetical protein
MHADSHARKASSCSLSNVEAIAMSEKVVNHMHAQENRFLAAAAGLKLRASQESTPL